MYLFPLASPSYPLGYSADTEMDPEGHWLHCFELALTALKPTGQGLHASPPMLAYPGSQALQVPAVVPLSED